MKRTNNTDAKTQISIELQANAKVLRRKALAAEAAWRAERGFRAAGPVPANPITKRRPKPLSRKEIERREQRRRQWIERQALRMPLLKGV